MGIAQFGSLDNLLNAYATVYRYLLDNYEDHASLKRLWGYLANNVVFIQISTSVSSARKVFETINERGVRLNPMGHLVPPTGGEGQLIGPGADRGAHGHGPWAGSGL